MLFVWYFSLMEFFPFAIQTVCLDVLDAIWDVFKNQFDMSSSSQTLLKPGLNVVMCK